jgi:hypothetical protein
MAPLVSRQLVGSKIESALYIKLLIYLYNLFNLYNLIDLYPYGLGMFRPKSQTLVKVSPISGISTISSITIEASLGRSS